ncbi:hypothetical protein M427DRAFT_30043 [Gonapodya prolifera JEL478]|uniref:Polynucleotide 5'-hydroxyl-kinase GRC3 n=1 Tax=Gonapodya prolifera (strain JEL478) TaxID=1344416 RepID=A0A139AMB7_GONPJ|nr:hypothetical protein M427DRAFT_30043 [Gonapodya prolifera JEL478]|eukprot:KXS17916.1 hypothetical protein M427DRAFT_30043 [Gonapodya prolifera JEL478]
MGRRDTRQNASADGSQNRMQPQSSHPRKAAAPSESSTEQSSSLYAANPFAALRKTKPKKEMEIPPPDLREPVQSAGVVVPDAVPAPERLPSRKRKRELSSLPPASAKVHHVATQSSPAAVARPVDAVPVRTTTFVPTEHNVRTAGELSGKLCVVAMMEGEALAFRGCVGIAPLRGSVRVNGFTYTAPSTRAQKILSDDQDAAGRVAAQLEFFPCLAPRMGPALSLESVKDASSHHSESNHSMEDSTSPTPTELTPTIRSLVAACKPLLSLPVLETASIVALCSASFVGADGVGRYFGGWKDFWGERDAKDCSLGGTVLPGFCPILDPTDTTPILQTPRQFFSLVPPGPLSRVPIVAVMGTKQSGKSTLARFIANQLLTHYGETDWLECDPGQPEVCPVGCVGLVRLRYPLNGPAFANMHLQPGPGSRWLFLGSTTPKTDPDYYTACLTELLRTRDSSRPLVVNLHGWTRGMGLDMTVHLMSTLRPTVAVELVMEGGAADVLPHVASVSQETTCHTMHSPPRPVGYKKPDPAEMRQLNMLGHLHQRAQESLAPFRLSDGRGRGRARWDFSVENGPAHRLPLYAPMSALSIRVLHTDVPPAHCIQAVHGTIVALCKEEDDVSTRRAGDAGPFIHPTSTPCAPSLSECVGLGIVRSIDNESGHILLATALSAVQLARARVNTIVRGGQGMEVGASVYEAGWQNVRDLPYLTSNFVEGIGAMAKRVRHDLKRRRSQGIGLNEA